MRKILTKREEEVFSLLVKNMTTKEIAKSLGISEKTVNVNTVLTATANYGCGFRGWYDKSGIEVCYTTDFPLPLAIM